MKNKAIIDLEASCCDKGSIPREQMEIIEIGCTIIDANLKNLISFSIFVKPQINPKLTDFCKNLTSISQEHIDRYGITFEEAEESLYKLFEAFQVDEWYSWGDYDKNQFKKDFAKVSIENWLDEVPHKNIKKEVAKKIKIKPAGICKVLNYLNLPFLGTPHRGVDDTNNILRILQEIQYKTYER